MVRGLSPMILFLLVAALPGSARAEEVVPAPGSEERFLDLLRRATPLPGDLRAGARSGAGELLWERGEVGSVDLLLGRTERRYLGGGGPGGIPLAGQGITVISPVPTPPSPAVAGEWREVIGALRSGGGDDAGTLSRIERLLGREDLAGDGRVLFLAGMVRFRRGEGSEAEGAFLQASKLDTDDPMPLLFVGMMRIQDGRVREAVPALESAVERAPASTTAHGLLGEAFARLAAHADAVRHLAPAVGSPSAPPAWRLLLARSLLALRRPEDASKQLLALKPAVREGMGATLLAARIAFAKKEVEAALALVERAAERRPKAALPYVVAASRLLAGGRQKDAAEYAMKALARDASLPGPWWIRAEAELLLGQVEAAEKSAARAAAIAGGDPVVRVLLAKVHLARGRAGEGIRALREVVREHPGLAGAHFLLGEALRESGKEDEAAAAFEKFLELRPRGPRADRVREILKTLR